MKEFKDTLVLVVDDDEDLREVIELEFLRVGFKVVTAANGAEAFEIIKSRKIDAVISDIRMPIVDGKELLALIRQYDPEIPVVIFVSGFSDLTPEEAIKRGASSVLSKPFKREDLMNSVIKALSK